MIGGISDYHLDCLQKIAYDFEDKKIDKAIAKQRLIALKGDDYYVDDWLESLEDW